jgi:hypothetical protein
LGSLELQKYGGRPPSPELKSKAVGTTIMAVTPETAGKLTSSMRLKNSLLTEPTVVQLPVVSTSTA